LTPIIELTVEKDILYFKLAVFNNSDKNFLQILDNQIIAELTTL